MDTSQEADGSNEMATCGQRKRCLCVMSVFASPMHCLPMIKAVGRRLHEQCSLAFRLARGLVLELYGVLVKSMSLIS